MKELTIEQKAKRYDEAIENLRRLHDNYDTVSTLIDIKEELENIFPELKESEDEMVRKALIRFHKSTIDIDGIKGEQIVAWLERQGDKYDKIVEKAKSEKQRVLITETNGNAGIDWDTRSLADTKMLLEYGLDFINKKLENHDGQNPAWSEEDEYLLGETIQRIEELIRISKYCGIDVQSYQRDIDWLKSLKDRVGCEVNCTTTNEWSEEDEQYVKDTLALLSFGCSIHGITQVQDWLKSLKDRYTWKPSEEQMKALNYVVNLMASSKSPTENDLYYNILKSLRQQLKKLREK